ncbi:divergent PAP2 family protein [Candidatus Woesearchaeota archaeon]|nr:divergent PAP2 family protein [Candidatus Woesearchaeota archaeon]
MAQDLILLLQNKVFISIVLAWLISQILKVFANYYKTKKFDKELLWKSGGMPSSHSASVASLSAAIYLSSGVTDLFVLSLAFAVLVMYDARGVRYESSKHASLLNRIIKSMKVKSERLEERIGHRTKEIIAGAVLGIIIAYAVFLL